MKACTTTWLLQWFYEIVPHRLRCLNTWFPFRRSFWIGLGCVDLMEEIHQLGQALRFQELRAVFKFAVCLRHCEVSTHCFSHHTLLLPRLPASTVMRSVPLELQVLPLKVALATLFYDSSIKQNNTYAFLFSLSFVISEPRNGNTLL